MILASLPALLLATLSPAQGIERYLAPNGPCNVPLHGRWLFMGSERCMRALPRSDLSGFLIEGPEELCFATTYRDVVHLATGSCSVALLARDGLLPFHQNGARNVYRVDLRVAGNGRKGFYGHGGATPYGYYIVALKTYRYVGVVERLAAKSGKR